MLRVRQTAHGGLSLNDVKKMIFMINTKQIVRALSNPRIDRIGLACEVISSASSYKELQQIVKQIPLIHKGLFKFAYLKRKGYAHFNQIC